MGKGTITAWEERPTSDGKAMMCFTEEAKGPSMFKLPKSTNESFAAQRQEQNPTHEVNSFPCSICGGNYYDLILYAHALSRRNGLRARCRTCDASITLLDEELDFI